MEYLNAQLRQLQQRVARKNHLQARSRVLRGQRDALLRKASQLDRIAMKEEADVARLEGRSLAAFFYNVVGRMDAKLDQERREAYAARVKYDAAVRELQSVEQDLTACSAELASLSLCEEHYRMCLEEKAAAIKASGSPHGLEILRLETCLQTLDCQLLELNEAADAGNTALFTAKSIQAILENAGNLSTWDIFGCGLSMDTAAHHRLDDGQAMIEKLQIQLCRFRTELTDVCVDADIQISMVDFDRFADSFFDGLFSDWVVMDRIDQARAQVKQVAGQIELVLRKLDERIRLTQTDMRCHRYDLNERITTA